MSSGGSEEKLNVSGYHFAAFLDSFIAAILCAYDPSVQPLAKLFSDDLQPSSPLAVGPSPFPFLPCSNPQAERWQLPLQLLKRTRCFRRAIQALQVKLRDSRAMERHPSEHCRCRSTLM